MERRDQSDRELIARIREGDEAAFRTLCTRHESALLARIGRTLPRALQRKVEPRDILQDAYVVAWARFDEFEGQHEASYGSWLGQIVAFKQREAARRYLDTGKRDARKEKSRGARPDTHKVLGRGATPSQEAMAGELEARMARILAELPADYRQVLQLVQADGLSLQDTAEQMGRSYEATKKLYGRALKRLRSLVAEEG